MAAVTLYLGYTYEGGRPRPTVGPVGLSTFRSPCFLWRSIQSRLRLWPKTASSCSSSLAVRGSSDFCTICEVNLHRPEVVANPDFRSRSHLSAATCSSL